MWTITTLKGFGIAPGMWEISMVSKFTIGLKHPVDHRIPSPSLHSTFILLLSYLCLNSILLESYLHLTWISPNLRALFPSLFSTFILLVSTRPDRQHRESTKWDPTTTKSRSPNVLPKSHFVSLRLTSCFPEVPKGCSQNGLPLLPSV